MAVELIDNTVTFTGSIFEDTLITLQSSLNDNKKALTFDCTECKDLHGAIIQLIVAHNAVYGGNFIFSSEPKLYQKAIEGFHSVEDDCN